MKFAVAFLAVWSWLPAADFADLPQLTQGIPPRPPQSIAGSEFAKFVSGMDPRRREQAILDQILEGNIPNFLRKLAPVELKYERSDGKPVLATIFVLPDYLAIGSNQDFLRIPMNLETAAAVVDRLGFVLPTRKMVDAIYQQARYHFVPEPLPAGPEMRSTAYYLTHNSMIEKQAHSRGFLEGALVSGDKKDVVLTNLLTANAGRIAIYGWHRPTGVPIQPLSIVHGACYADYSHGIRLVSKTVVVDGKPRLISDVLHNPLLAKVLSDEGPIRTVLAPRSASDFQCGIPGMTISILAPPSAP